jgi:hypothetical protein
MPAETTGDADVVEAVDTTADTVMGLDAVGATAAADALAFTAKTVTAPPPAMNGAIACAFAPALTAMTVAP